MKANEVLIRPIVTEKANKQSEKHNRFSFAVDYRSNKLEIKKAIETFYGVTVEEVNTAVVPAKAKSRYTKAGLLSGRKSGYKKAVVTLAAGETIDLYSF